MELLEAEGKAIAEKDRQKLAEYKKDQDGLSAEANEKERSSEEHLHKHALFSRGVTVFQIAIAIGAIAALTSRRSFWFLSLGLGVLGVLCLAQGCLAH